jgi:hypothetical protein
MLCAGDRLYLPSGQEAFYWTQRRCHPRGRPDPGDDPKDVDAFRSVGRKP